MATKKKTSKKKATSKPDLEKPVVDEPSEPASEDAVSAAIAADEAAVASAVPVPSDPDPSLLEELHEHGELQQSSPLLPSVPSLGQLLADGFDEAAANIIISHMKAIHEEIDALHIQVPMKLVPGLSVRSKSPQGFWICGHHVKPGQPWEVALEHLNEEQRVELETVKIHLSIEETEVEIPE